MGRKVLVIGAGGREHAIVRQLAASPEDPIIFAAPGNPGTGALAQNVDLDPLVPDDIVGFCRREAVDLVIIGPEDPLIAGLADHLHKAGFAVFGPGAPGARKDRQGAFALLGDGSNVKVSADGVVTLANGTTITGAKYYINTRLKNCP